MSVFHKSDYSTKLSLYMILSILKKEHVLTTILPTSRAIREKILHLSQEDVFLPRFLSMDEFMTRAIVIDGFLSVDIDRRVMTLLEASDFSSFKELKIERNFFTFINNSSYIFSFYKELLHEMVSLDALDCADVYEEAHEHIQILKLLLKRYRELSFAQKELDPIFAPELYRLNVEYIRSLGPIVLKDQGYFTNFELKILDEVSQIVPLTLEFEASRFNVKMQKKLKDRGIKLDEGYLHTIDFKSSRVLKQEIVTSSVLVSSTAISSRILQVSFVKEKIYGMIKDGIDAKDIVVVLPDESMSGHLRSFNDEGYFNFAMGLSLDNSEFVAACKAVVSYATEQSVENSWRFKRVLPDDMMEFIDAYDTRVDIEYFELFVERVLELESKMEVREIVQEQLFYFRQLLLNIGEDQTLKRLIHLFLDRVKKRSVDDVGGGKITVMGLLETRGCHFDGVIIVDFNDSFVPRRSEKDLFINSALRERVSLPTRQERESLQKLHYYQLIRRAKRVEISYVQSEVEMGSRFLKELEIRGVAGHSDRSYASILFDSSPQRELEPHKIVQKFDFREISISPTALKLFLECKRAFYYRYVAKIREHKMPQDSSIESEMGSALHRALFRVYSVNSSFADVKLLKASFAKELSSECSKSEIEGFLRSFWIEKLEPFYQNEIERFKSVRVFSCESSKSVKYKELRLKGEIDRIDMGENGLQILDYKSGKISTYTKRNIESATDFQLEFYYLLMEQEQEVEYCGYYDLNSATIVKEPLFEEKLELLKSHLDSLMLLDEISFDMCEDVKRCRYCAYVDMCNRRVL